MIILAMADPERIVDEAWSDAGPAALIDHIVRRYHEVHLAELPDLIAMARRVEAVHQDHPWRPQGLGDHLAVIADHLMSHQHREEAVLFPLMLAGGSSMIGHPIRRMLEEHGDVEEQLLRLAVLTTDFTTPADACSTWRRLYRACQTFSSDLHEHMRLENDILFPQFA